MLQPILPLALALALSWPLILPLEAGAQGEANFLVTEALRLLGAEQGALPVGSSTVEGRLIAREWTQRALALDPSNAEAHVRLGQVWLEEGRYEAAIA